MTGVYPSLSFHGSGSVITVGEAVMSGCGSSRSMASSLAAAILALSCASCSGVIGLLFIHLCPRDPGYQVTSNRRDNHVYFRILTRSAPLLLHFLILNHPRHS